jgi:hypothetical protein
MPEKSELRAALAALALLLVVGLAVFAPYLTRSDVLLGPHSGLGSDITYRHWPDLLYYTAVLRAEGRVPLWDDTVAGGRPLAGDPGAIWLYPFDLVFLLLPPALAFAWFDLLHIWIGGLGATLFMRKGLGLSLPAALLGGCAFMLSPKFIAHLAGGHLGLVASLAWLPWVLLGVARAATGDFRGSLLAAAALALQMPGHIQVTFYSAWLALVFAAWQLLAEIGLPRLRWRMLAAIAAILPAFIALSAALLFPLLELLPYSSRQGFSLQDASWYSLPVWLLGTVLSPAGFQFPEWVLYPGAVPILLAVLGLSAPRRRQAAFWAGVVLFALVYALGPATPLFPLLQRLPGFAQLRVPPRAWLIGCFAASVLAAHGADFVSRPGFCGLVVHQRWLRLLALVVYGAEATAALAIPWLSQTSSHYLWGTLATSLAALGLLYVACRRRLPARWLATGLLGLTLLELAPLARSFMSPMPVDPLVSPSPIVQFLAGQPGAWRVYSTSAQLPYAAAAAAGIESAEGLLAFQIGHYVELANLAAGCQVETYGTGVPPCLTSEGGEAARLPARPDPALLGLLNVRYVLSDGDLPASDFNPVFFAAGQTLYENRRGLPRAFVVFQARQLPDQSAVLAALPSIDPAALALLAGQNLHLNLTSAGEGRSYVTANITARTSSTFTVSLTLDIPGLLVVSRTWLPGWQAWIDGLPTQVERVDYALQGVFLPAGSHTVYFAYHPLGWRLGWPVSAAAWLLLILGGSAFASVRFARNRPLHRSAG